MRGIAVGNIAIPFEHVVYAQKSKHDRVGESVSTVIVHLDNGNSLSSSTLVLEFDQANAFWVEYIAWLLKGAG